MENKSNNDLDNNNFFDPSKYKIVRLGKDEDISKFTELTYKVIIIGDPYVGKTSIIHTLVKELELKGNYKPTVGFDIFIYSCHVNEVVITLQIWDTGGEIDISNCTRNLYKNASLTILVYDVSSSSSFKDLENWVNLIKTHASAEVLVFLVGNKVDLEKKVSKEEGVKFVELYGFKFFCETSAKEKKNIKELFDKALVELYELNRFYNEKDIEEKEDLSRKKSFTLDRKKSIVKNKEKSCCI